MTCGFAFVHDTLEFAGRDVAIADAAKGKGKPHASMHHEHISRIQGKRPDPWSRVSRSPGWICPKTGRSALVPQPAPIFIYRVGATLGNGARQRRPRAAAEAVTCE